MMVAASRGGVLAARQYNALSSARTYGVRTLHNVNKAQRRSSTQSATTSSTGNSSAASKSLAQVLADSIRASGPLSVSTFMRTCLLDPQQGYYASANAQQTDSDAQNAVLRDVLGARGDFITSPEISQVFGELVAIFFIARWQTVNPPAQTRLVELGPGRGTLLADMIRTFSRFKAFFKDLKTIHLVETSQGLMSLQHDALEDALSKVGKKLVGADKESVGEDEVQVEWFPLANSVPVQADTWTMVVAHEFFDALPSHIFEKTSEGFREVLVDIERAPVGQSGITVLKPGDLGVSGTAGSSASTSKEAKFRYVLSPTPTPWSMLLAERNARFKVLQPGQRVEISPESWATARRVGELIAGRKASETKPEQESETARVEREARELERLSGSSQGGAGLIVDYGDEKAFGASFRAFKSHEIVDPLIAPGTADLTCNVDFTHLKSALALTDARTLGPMFQSHFLHALGLRQRVDALTANEANSGRKEEIERGAERLTDAQGMGAQYKVMGICAEARQGGGVPAAARTRTTTASDGKPNETAKCYPFEM